MNGKKICSAVVVFAFGTMAASAQMAVHAMTGTVKAVTPQSLTLAVGSGSTTQFKLAPHGKVPGEFDHDLRADSTAPAEFQKIGDYVVLYYYGYGLQRTAFAVKDLGAGPYTKAQGTVVSYNKHTRELTLKDASGKDVSMVINDQLVVDTDTGAASGRKFSPHKGDPVRVTYSPGTPATVAFLGEQQ